ncbi:hypothetical protein T484DRAFT_3589234 [Baffinella frigidus]|nr:hypothetical protein T484DRAFT_3589234 [Cryptophyta sp. CCMP2293]
MQLARGDEDAGVYIAESLIATGRFDDAMAVREELKLEERVPLISADKVAAAREAKTLRYLSLPPHLPLERVLWVNSPGTLAEALRTLTDTITDARAHPPSTWELHPEGVVSVGLDVEWKPAWQRGAPDRPASILQASTPTRVMIFDLIWAAGEEGEANGHAAELDKVLTLLFREDSLLKIGFDFIRNDLEKLAASCPQL